MKKVVTLLFIISSISSIFGIMKLKDRVNKKYEEDSEKKEVPEIDNNIVDTSKAEYTYNEMVRDLNLLNRKYSGKIFLEVIGTTYDVRNIYEVILGNRNAENHVLIHAGIHGREYLNSILLMKQLEYYLKAYDSGSYKDVEYKTLFEKTAFHILPMVNPDGVSISQFGTDGIRNIDLKKCIAQCYERDLKDGYTSDDYKSYLNQWKANGRGVDLNRNFNAEWESINQCLHPSFEDYKGEKYESELETQALVKLTEKYDFVETISYHSSGNLIYWDYEYNLKKQDCSRMADIAAKITGYEKALSDSNYDNVVSGGYKDWASSKKNNPIPSITIETGTGNCPLNICEFGDLWRDNFDIWAAYAYSLN